MSASREKQNRQERANSGWVNPKTAREEQQRRQEKRTSMLYGIIAVVFVVVAAAAIIYRSNIIPKMTTAVTIDGEKYTAGEVDFYFQNAYAGFVNDQNIYYMISYLGLNASASFRDQVISEDAASIMQAMDYPTAEAGQTWYDFFLGLALEQMTQVQSALSQAKAEGFVYPAGVQAQYDDSMASLKTAAQASGVSVTQYLSSSFGVLMTEKIYSQQLLRILQFDAYANAYLNGLTYSDAELEGVYQESPESYDKVAYESVSVPGAAPSTTDEDGNTIEPTEEESDAAMAAARTASDGMLLEYLGGGQDLETLAAADESYYYSNITNGTYSGNSITQWLFDPERVPGDSAVVESGTTCYVLVFHERFREEYETIDIRHILVQPAAGTLTEEDEGYEAEQAQLNAEAKAKADELLARWQAGEATEDSFAALAMEESVDGSRYDGGLYTRVAQGEMVTAFNDWCFDESRQPGDTGVVETEYGYHVMYFSGKNLPAWENDVTSVLASEDYAEWVESLTAGSTITRSDSGLKYVG